MKQSVIKSLCSVLICICMLSVTLFPTHAVTESQSTPYGTMTATQISGWYISNHGADLRMHCRTSIDSTLTMRSITTTIEPHFRDTGEAIFERPFTYVCNNTNDTEMQEYEYSITEPNRGVTVYSSHQVLYTKAYVIYLRSIVDDYVPLD